MALSPRHIRFVSLYFEHGCSASKAYQALNPAAKNPDTLSNRLMQKPEIRREIGRWRGMAD